jgi:hypothetical protein
MKAILIDAKNKAVREITLEMNHASSPIYDVMGLLETNALEGIASPVFPDHLLYISESAGLEGLRFGFVLDKRTILGNAVILHRTDDEPRVPIDKVSAAIEFADIAPYH